MDVSKEARELLDAIRAAAGAAPLRSPSIPETHGTVALYGKGTFNPPEHRKRVIGWDTVGFALIADDDEGRLVRAVEVPDFISLYLPDAPYLGDPVTMIPALQGEPGVIAYAVYSDSTMLAIRASELSF